MYTDRPYCIYYTALVQESPGSTTAQGPATNQARPFLPGPWLVTALVGSFTSMQHSKVISGRLLTYDSARSCRFYNAVPLTEQATSTMTRYPTK